MENTEKDLEKMTTEELLAALVERLDAEFKSEARLSGWLAEKGWTKEDAEENDEDGEYCDLVMACDNDWCRVREIVRLVKGDPDMWMC